MEAKLKAALGEMQFMLIALQTQLEAAQKRIADLEKAVVKVEPAEE